MKIFIHIGDARTGTTTLQSFLTQNREKARKQGVDYPEIGLLHAEKGMAQHQLAFSLMEEWPKFAKDHIVDPKIVWTEFENYLSKAKSDYDACLISSEAFSSIPTSSISYLSDILGKEDVSVIYVRRDADDQRRSMREHRIRRGHYVPKASGPAVDKSSKIISQWSKCFPVEVIEYSRSSTKQVLDICGVDVSEFSQVQDLNVRPPDGLIDLLNSINKIDLIEENRLKINNKIWNWVIDKSNLNNH